MDYSKGEWKAGYNPGVTGPTTPAIQPFCGQDWPYFTINVGMETIAIVPAQTLSRGLGCPGEPIDGSAEANAHLMVAAPRMVDTLRMAREELCFGGDWETARKKIDEVLAKAEGI